LKVFFREMMNVKFCKIQGNGNDFIIIENMDGSISSSRMSDMAKNLCRRRQSLGADGILALEGAEKADFTMRLFNSDGSEGEMCGNGARCIARYAFERGIAPSVMSFETLAGVIRATVESPWVTLDMGTVDLSSAQWERDIPVGEEVLSYSFLNVGVPHCVVPVRDLGMYSREKLVEIGRAIRNDLARFPHGTNVNFMQITGGGEVNAVTYERGVEDLTESCGTGSTACALVAFSLFGLSSPVKVNNPGGINEVFLDQDPGGRECRAGLKGKTLIVATGDISLEALE
jgi:diaminopimelate epimerase